MSRILKCYSMIDEETGEVLLEHVSASKSENGKDWCIMYQMTAYLLATDSSFTFSDVRVYLYLVANVDYTCSYTSTKRAMAKSIDMSYPQLLASLTILKEHGLIKETKVRGATTFFINPVYVTRGKNRSELSRAYKLIPPEVVKRISIEEKVAEIAASF